MLTQPLAMRHLTPAHQPILWEMLYHALFVSSRQAPFPAGIVHNPDLSRYVEGWGRADSRFFGERHILGAASKSMVKKFRT